MRTRFFVVAMLMASEASAQSAPIQTIPPGDDRIISLQQGQQAPFTGQLFDTPTSLRWANWLAQYRQRLKDDVEREQQTCATKMRYDADVLKAEQAKEQTIVGDLRARLKSSEDARMQAEYEANHPPWYRTTWFGVGVGVVGTLLVVGATAYAVNAGK